MRNQIDIGRVISSGFAVIRREAKTMILISLIAMAVVIAGMAVALLVFYGLLGDADPTRGIFSLGGFSSVLIGGLVYLLAIVVGQGALVATAVRSLVGQPVSVGEALKQAMSRVLPLLGLTLLSWTAIAMGIAMFIVPGIILMIIWCVATPAFMVERLGVIAALERSGSLTQGSRWHVLGLFAIVFVGSLLFNGMSKGIELMAPHWAVATVLQVVIMIAGAIIAAAGASALYVELRTIREGGMSGGLTEVFN